MPASPHLPLAARPFVEIWWAAGSRFHNGYGKVAVVAVRRHARSLSSGWIRFIV